MNGVDSWDDLLKFEGFIDCGSNGTSMQNILFRRNN